MARAKRNAKGARAAPETRARVVAVIGSQTFLGRRLVARLVEEPDVDRIVAVDLRPPELPAPKVEFARLDLARPSADQELAEILGDGGVGTVAHLAFLGSPIGNAAYAHELEAIGTMHVLTAARAARVRRLVVQSMTAVYGAGPKHPSRIAEDRPLPPPRSRFLADKVEAERQVLHFAAEHAGVATAVLRFAAVVGPTVRNVFTRYLAGPVAPTVLGHDPLLQTLHEDDAAEALRLAVLRPALAGVFNVAADGVIPLSTALGLCGTVAVPLPQPFAAGAIRLLRTAGVAPVPPSLLDFLRYPCVADPSRFRREAGFAPLHTTRDAIVALASGRGRRAAG